MNNKILSILARAWSNRQDADAKGSKCRAFSVNDIGGSWLFNLSKEDSGKYVLTCKWYANNGGSPFEDFTKTFSTLGTVVKTGNDYEITLDANACPNNKGDVPLLKGMNSNIPPQFIREPAQKISGAEQVKIFKPKNDQGCECGAFVLGAQKGDTNHSDWCPAKGNGSKKKTPKAIKI